MDDLKGIYDYISRDSVKFAKIETIKLKVRTTILKRHAFAGKPVPELNNDIFRELIEGNYRIIYKIIDLKTIHILTIHHSARELTRRQLE
ncbi:MAG TPA: type II toxin-antitoxin system RelE/ParE family toxin [Saprospiraceae bacterium]|nr:type II toxin-antitoxin system RelE/ParE family toxin [Saprospiraceae bacterium]HQW56687.1 type II toxin-antitoxin system RelE/ParE family toxin [Saprospiraceae bacterium]